jgi:hypothetical protein
VPFIAHVRRLLTRKPPQQVTYSRLYAERRGLVGYTPQMFLDDHDAAGQEVGLLAGVAAMMPFRRRPSQ